MSVSARRILIIKWGALGDVIVATPHIDVIASAYPEARIRLLTAPAYAPLFAHDSRLELVVRERRGFREMARTLAWVVAARFDAVFDLQGNDRSAALTFVSRARLRTGLGPAYAYNRIPPSRAQRDRHIFDRLNGLLVHAGLPEAPPRPRLRVGEDERRRVRAWLDAHDVAGRPLVLLHAGASRRWVSKRWPAGSFRRLAEMLRDAGLAPVWIGGPADADINAPLAEAVGADATGAFSLLELAALGEQARFAVTSDSGPMHVLSGAGIPVYAFFGPTDWRRSHAVGNAERVLRHPVPCSPCHLPVCPPDKHHACLDQLSVETVVDRLERDGLLNGAEPAQSE